MSDPATRKRIAHAIGAGVEACLGTSASRAKAAG